MPITFGFIKISILLLYQRLFIGIIFKRISNASIVIIILWSLAFAFATAFQCGSRPQNWWTSTFTILHYCSKTQSIELGFAVSDVITDLVILSIPQPVVWRLHMSKSQRIGLSFVFLLGLMYVQS